MPMSVCFGVEARGGRLSVCHPFRDAGLPDRYWVAGEGRAVAVSGCRAGVGPVVGDSLVVHAVEVTTDKDGIILCLLASEITAVTGCTPSEHYADLVARFGDPAYARTDVPAAPEQKAVPGNGAGIGGLKVGAESGWFAARPSGTDDVYKIYAESFRGPEHVAQIQDEARGVVSAA